MIYIKVARNQKWNIFFLSVLQLIMQKVSIFMLFSYLAIFKTILVAFGLNVLYHSFELTAVSFFSYSHFEKVRLSVLKNLFSVKKPTGKKWWSPLPLATIRFYETTSMLTRPLKKSYTSESNGHAESAVREVKKLLAKTDNFKELRSALRLERMA